MGGAEGTPHMWLLPAPHPRAIPSLPPFLAAEEDSEDAFEARIAALKTAKGETPYGETRNPKEGAKDKPSEWRQRRAAARMLPASQPAAERTYLPTSRGAKGILWLPAATPALS